MPYIRKILFCCLILSALVYPKVKVTSYDSNSAIKMTSSGARMSPSNVIATSDSGDLEVLGFWFVNSGLTYSDDVVVMRVAFNNFLFDSDDGSVTLDDINLLGDVVAEIQGEPLVYPNPFSFSDGGTNLNLLEAIEHQMSVTGWDRWVDEDGNWLIPVITGVSFENDDEANAYLIASNRLVEKGGWKEDELVELLQDVAVSTEDLSGTGFDLDDIEGILNKMESDIFEDEDIPEPDDETIVRFKFGRYKFGIDAEVFYGWETQILEDLGTNSPQELIEWIKEQLHLRG